MDIRSWTNHIIEIYDKSETSDVYKRRSNNESKNIKSVLKAIQEQKFRLLSTQNRADFIHLLKAADSISLDIGTDYLEQFLKLPDVQKIITERLTSNDMAKVTQRALGNEQSGNLSRFYEHILKIADTGIFSIKTDATTLQDITSRQNMMVRLGRVICRQQGMNPGSMNLEDGRITFEMDVPDKEPIFHGMQQEQVLTIAQQERLEEEQRHVQEKNGDAKNKRENSQGTNKESSKELSAAESFMQQAKKSQPKQTRSNSFLNSLKSNTENINRTNVLQSQNQSNARKRSKAMGRSL